MLKNPFIDRATRLVTKALGFGGDDVSQNYMLGSKAYSNEPRLFSKTHDFGSISSGGSESTTITAEGVSLGQGLARPPWMDIDQDGVVLHGYVSAANTITVIAKNTNAGIKDLPSGTIFVEIE